MSTPEKKYRDYNTYLRDIFGERVQKIALDSGLNCPNRDGTLSSGGCIYCDSRGSGTGALTQRGVSIREQVVDAQERLQKRYGAKKFIAYFQSFTNTYGPIEKLKQLYDEALCLQSMVGLSIGTRPDCVDEDIMSLIHTYKQNYLVWLELGLQSSHDITLRRINRGHDVASFERSVLLAHTYGLNICAHIILGLPGEDRKMMLQTAHFIARLPIAGIKIHLLYVVKGTPLANLYENKEFRCLERNEYADLVVDLLELLPSRMVVQRLTGDPVRSELIAPNWAMEKHKNLSLIQERLERRNTWQGRLCRKFSVGK